MIEGPKVEGMTFTEFEAFRRLGNRYRLVGIFVLEALRVTGRAFLL